MVKAYLRYELASSWGVLASNSDICYTHDGAHLVTAALENVNIWNVKRALVVGRGGLAGWRVGWALLTKGMHGDEAHRLAHSPVLEMMHCYLTRNLAFTPPHSLCPQVETLKAPATQSGKPVGEITRLAASPVSDQIAAGHSDGTVRVWVGGKSWRGRPCCGSGDLGY